MNLRKRRWQGKSTTPKHQRLSTVPTADQIVTRMVSGVGIVGSIIQPGRKTSGVAPFVAIQRARARSRKRASILDRVCQTHKKAIKLHDWTGVSDSCDIPAESLGAIKATLRRAKEGLAIL